MLFACVFVPNFSMQASLRSEPAERRTLLAQRPVALVDGPDSLPRVFALNEPAQLAGIAPGMTKAQAEQCPGIVVRRRVMAMEEAAQAALLDCASAFSPRVESTLPGAVTLDITGTGRIFGPPQKLATSLAGAAARVGLEANVAIAANPDVSLVTARGFQGTLVIPAGKEADYLAQLPVEVLAIPPQQAEILDSWGIRKCRDLALLPPVPLVERLGQAGLHFQKLARGESRRTLVAAEPALRFEETLQLEEPLDDLESLAFLLNRLLEQLAVRLRSRALATDELRLQLELEVHPDRDIREEIAEEEELRLERRLKLPVPMQDAKVLLKLLQLDLAAHPPSAAVKRIFIEAQPAPLRHTQAGLFAPLAPQPEKLEITLARLRGVVGEADAQGRSRVGSPQRKDSNRPGDFQVHAFHPETGKEAAGADGGWIVALRLFRPPLPARVRCQGTRPSHIAFGEVKSEVLCAAGPWKISGHWWNSSEQWEREQWDIAVAAGNGSAEDKRKDAAGNVAAGSASLYRIFRDVREGGWFVEGLYD